MLEGNFTCSRVHTNGETDLVLEIVDALHYRSPWHRKSPCLMEWRDLVDSMIVALYL